MQSYMCYGVFARRVYGSLGRARILYANDWGDQQATHKFLMLSVPPSFGTHCSLAVRLKNLEWPV